MAGESKQLSLPGAVDAPLTPEQAKKFLRANVMNLGRKVLGGKVLSAQEMALLQSYASGEDNPNVIGWAMNQVELAAALQVNRKTVQRWLKAKGNPGAKPDGRMNVPEWRAWATAQGHNFEDKDKVHNKTALECERILKQNTLLDIEIQTREGELTPNAMVERWVAEMVGAAKTVLLSLPGILAPQVVGLSVPEAERRIREHVDEALSQLHRRPWQP